MAVWTDYTTNCRGGGSRPASQVLRTAHHRGVQQRSRWLTKNNMTRVLLAVHKFFPSHRAGTEVLALKTAQELMRRGYEVLVVAANPPDQDARHAVGPEASKYVFEGVSVHVLEEALRLKSFTFHSEYYHAEMNAHFQGILDSFQPDIVHIFHAQNLSASIIEAARERDIPVVFFAMDFWFVCPVVQLKRPDGTICRGPSTQAVNCLTCYTPKLFPPVFEFMKAIERKYPTVARLVNAMPLPIRRLVERVLFAFYAAGKVPSAIQATKERPDVLRQAINQTQAILVPTKIMREIFIENGVRRDLIQHLGFGIDTDPLTPYRNKPASDTLRIGFIGTFFEHKGVDLLIEAFQSLPSEAKANLTLYGDLKQFPDYAKQLVALAQRERPNSKKIKFAGTFPNSMLGVVLSEMDVLVVPSRWYENTPLVIQSALATKTPVIATDLGGMSELIKHGVNGLLFRLNDSHSLADQLLKLLKDRSLIGRLRANILDERTTAEMVDEIEGVFVRVLNVNRGASAVTIRNMAHEGTLVSSLAMEEE